MGRPEEMPWTYSGADWNPITYAEAAAPGATPQDAYRGSKVLAEQEAWNFMPSKDGDKPRHFDLVTLCPSMVFGPVATPPFKEASSAATDHLNESNKLLWKVLSGDGDALPPCRFNFWIDVRDLAEVHTRALFTPAAGGKRYVPVADEPFTYSMASGIFEEVAGRQGKVLTGPVQEIKTHVKVDMNPVFKDLPGIKFTSFRTTMLDFAEQFKEFL